MPATEMVPSSPSSETFATGIPSSEMPAPQPQSPMAAPFAPPQWSDAGNLSYPSYATLEASQYASYATPQPMTPQPVAMPLSAEPRGPRLEPVWRRWLIIGGTAVAAIVVAFVIARLVRGSPRAESRVVAGGGHVVASASPPPPVPDRTARAGSGSASATAASAEPTVDRNPKADPRAIAAAGAGSGGARGEPSPTDGGDGASGGTPVVGSGPCRLTVATTPAASIVRLDDVAIGPSPLTIASTCEKHKIELSHARYQNLTRWVTLSAGQPQELDVNLPRPVHAVTIASFPTGAELSIDGRRAGTTPMIIQMMGFATVNLTFSKAGFQSVTKKVYSKLPQDHVFVKLMK
jgi:hypothetical protein